MRGWPSTTQSLAATQTSDGHPPVRPPTDVFAAVGHFFRSEPVFFTGTLDKDKFNPIENVWSQLQRIVNRKKSKNVKQLKKAIRRAWSNLDFKQIRKFTSLMPARFKALRAAHGGGTGY